jgi:serine/threonine protein kinase
MNDEQQQLLTNVARHFCAARGLEFSRPAGCGAFKATFRVVDQDGRPLAAKVYLSGATTDRQTREIEAMTRLSSEGHRSLPAFQDLVTFECEGRAFYVSLEEFLEGGSMSEAINTARLERDDLVRVGQQLAGALDVVARHGLVHRDIKPDNIMFRGDRTAVLVDFGLVRNLALESITQTWQPRGPGTPLFSPSEQLRNEKDMISARSDQFSLGVTLAIAGGAGHPYAHPGDNPPAIVARVERRERPSPEFVTWANDLRLAPLVKMVQPWPVERYRLPPHLVEAWARL